MLLYKAEACMVIVVEVTMILITQARQNMTLLLQVPN
jgi:hypothetical protein